MKRYLNMFHDMILASNCIFTRNADDSVCVKSSLSWLLCSKITWKFVFFLCNQIVTYLQSAQLNNVNYHIGMNRL